MFEDDEDADRVLGALILLAREQPIWSKNYQMFTRMDSNVRIWWWRAAKKQAALGVPAMQTLVMKVIELRMTS